MFAYQLKFDKRSFVHVKFDGCSNSLIVGITKCRLMASQSYLIFCMPMNLPDVSRLEYFSC